MLYQGSMLVNWIYLPNCTMSEGKRVIWVGLFLGVLLLGCKKYPWDECDVGEGDGFTVTRNFENFHTFILDIPAQIELTPDTNLKSSRIEIFGQKNVTEQITTSIDNGVVSVSFDKCFKSHSDIEFRVYTPWLKKLVLNSASRIKTTKALYGDHFTLDVNSGTSIDVVCVLDSLRAELGSAGNIELNGYASRQNIENTSNAIYQAQNLISDSCIIDMSGAGVIDVYSTGHLIANLSGNGIINFYGEDTLHIDTVNTAAGSINDKR